MPTQLSFTFVHINKYTITHAYTRGYHVTAMQSQLPKLYKKQIALTNHNVTFSTHENTNTIWITNVYMKH